jgi:hypothetical protein
MSAQFTGPLGNKRDLDAYFSNDPSHLPLLLDSELFVGHVQVRLADVKRHSELPARGIEQLVP